MPCRHLLGPVLLLGLLPAAAQNPVGQIFATDAGVKGSVQLAAGGMQIMSGSSITAGESAAMLRLSRGGEVRVCPRTNVSVSSSQNGRDLMFGMNNGALETHYTLAASADAVLTPDFRILLAGPGSFHFAVGADPRGNTCVRPLAQNTASLIVTELMGDGAYQVKPDEGIVFHAGRVADHEPLSEDCGCPPPPPVTRASAENAPPAASSQALETPAEAANQVHVQVDAPFVFRATDPVPAPLEQVARLRAATAPRFPLTASPPQSPSAAPSRAEAPAATAKPQKKGFLGRVRKFFASIFH